MSLLGRLVHLDENDDVDVDDDDEDNIDVYLQLAGEDHDLPMLDRARQSSHGETETKSLHNISKYFIYTIVKLCHVNLRNLPLMPCFLLFG